MYKYYYRNFLQLILSMKNIMNLLYLLMFPHQIFLIYINETILNNFITFDKLVINVYSYCALRYGGGAGWLDSWEEIWKLY